MKFLKRILVVIVGVIALALFTALFTKKEYAVEREIVINQPKVEVFAYVKMLKNQNNYSAWAMIDPKMKKDFTGTDGTIGFVSAWDSENKEVGQGEQEITGIVEGERLDFELRFIRPFKATDNAYLLTENVEVNQTKVKWGFNGKMNYPMNLMLLIMDMDKILGDQLQIGLDNLKNVLENMPASTATTHLMSSDSTAKTHSE